MGTVQTPAFKLQHCQSMNNNFGTAEVNQSSHFKVAEMPENRYDYTQPKTGNKSNKQLNPNVLRYSWSTMGWRQNYWHACERRMNELFEHCKYFCLQIILAWSIVILQKNVVLSEKGKYKLVSNFRDFLQHFVFKVSCEQIMFFFFFFFWANNVLFLFQ